MLCETTNNPLLSIVTIAKIRHFTIEDATSLFIFRAYFMQINIGTIIRNNKAIKEIDLTDIEDLKDKIDDLKDEIKELKKKKKDE